MIQKKILVDFNHVSNKLTSQEIQELKKYYATFHKKKWAFTQKYNKLKRWKIIGNTASIMFGAGGLASSIATSGLALLGISVVALLNKAYMEHKNLELKLHTTQFAYQSFDHILNMIKQAARSGKYNRDELLEKWQVSKILL